MRLVPAAAKIPRSFGAAMGSKRPRLPLDASRSTKEQQPTIDRQRYGLTQP